MKKIRIIATGLLLFLFPLFAAAAINPLVFRIQNGIPVYFVQRKNLPMLDIAVVFAAGSVRDGTQFGLANLTEDLVGRGSRDYNEKEISNTMASTGAIMNSWLTRDMSVWTLRSLVTPGKLKKALAVFHSVLTRPSFPDPVLTRLRNQVRIQLLRQQAEPMAVATNAFFKATLPGSGYAHTSLGTKKTIARVTRKDCQRFYRHYYVSGNAFIVLVGDLTAQRAKQIAGLLSAGLQRGEAAPVIQPIVAQQSAKIFIPLKKSQTTLVIGQQGFPVYGYGYYARLLGNNVFGGSGLNSILADEVREKRGLAYFAYSKLTKLQGNGPLVMLSQTRLKNAAKAYQTMVSSYREFLKNGVTKKQLESAKNSLIGRYQLATVSNQSILVNLVSMVFYNYPLNYFKSFAKKIRAISQKDIVAAFANLRGKALVAVMVGKNNAFKEAK